MIAWTEHWASSELAINARSSASFDLFCRLGWGLDYSARNRSLEKSLMSTPDFFRSRLDKRLRCRAGGYAHAKQFERPKRVLKRQKGLIVGARSLAGNPYDAPILAEPLEQISVLLQDLSDTPRVKTILADLGFRGANADAMPVQSIRWNKSKTPGQAQRRWLKCHQAIEPIVEPMQQGHGMRRGWLKDATSDALLAVLCAAGYNLRWLLRAIARLGIQLLYSMRALLRLFANFISVTSISPRLHNTPQYLIL